MYSRAKKFWQTGRTSACVPSRSSLVPFGGLDSWSNALHYHRLQVIPLQNKKGVFYIISWAVIMRSCLLHLGQYTNPVQMIRFTTARFIFQKAREIRPIMFVHTAAMQSLSPLRQYTICYLNGLPPPQINNSFFPKQKPASHILWTQICIKWNRPYSRPSCRGQAKYFFPTFRKIKQHPKTQNIKWIWSKGIFPQAK